MEKEYIEKDVMLSKECPFVTTRKRNLCSTKCVHFEEEISESLDTHYGLIDVSIARCRLWT